MINDKKKNNQTRIRTFGEKRKLITQKLLLFKSKKKKISEDKKQTSRSQAQQPNPLQKKKHLGSTPCYILWTILKMDKGRTLTNGAKHKETDDNTLDLTHERYH